MNNKQNHLSRRQFIRHSTLLSAGLALTPFNVGAAEGNDAKITSVGLQLYTLRADASTDLVGTLARVAELGFREIEFAGYYGNSPTEIRTILDDHGLISSAAHIQMAALRVNLQQEIGAAATIGQKYIFIPIAPASERTLDDYRRHAEFLNQAGAACQEAGLRIGYHNHDFEFDEIDGQVPYDILLEETDSALVDFELDLFWIVHAGRDPLEYFSKYPGRFPAVHVKDRTADGTMVAVGQGTIDFAEIFKHSQTAGIKHYFVEHDNPVNGFESVAYSINTVRNLQF